MRSLPRLFPLALAASIALIAFMFIWLRPGTDSDTYATARGEQRSIVLSDGSIVQLNTLTKIDVDFDGRQRSVLLPQGEAFFRVARDAKRPFEVRTPFAVVRAIGTEFNVYNRGQSTQVAVIGGSVAVSHPQSSQPITLVAGSSATITEKHVEPMRAQQTVPATQLATAWIQRRIVLDNTRVDGAVAEFNRYNKLQMQVENPSLAELRISGVFNADDPEALMKYLERIQNVRIQRGDREAILRRDD